jgi:hypothetical protein
MHDEYTASLRLMANRMERAVSEFLAVYDVTLGIEGQPQAIRLRGHLRVPADKAYPEISDRLRELGYTAILRRDDEVDLDELVAVPGAQPEVERPRFWVHGLLFGATVLTTLYVGAGMSEARPLGDLWWPIFHLWEGWPFALSLLTILLAHEMGHYVASLRNGVAASLPYFIPLPIPDFLGNVLGTLGAVIRMKGIIPNRRVMLDIGAAGPLTGLIVTIPVLVIGLWMSHIEPLPVDQVYSMEGNSLLYLLVKFALFGRWLPSHGVDVFIHPVAFAGWAGLLVTSLNLIPAGQLDGGHVLYSLIGDRAQLLRWPIIAGLAGLGLLVWQGWFLWAGLVYFLGRGHPPPLDGLTQLGVGRKVLAVLVLAVFVLTFTPQPLVFVFPEGMGPTVHQSVLGLGGTLAGLGILARRLNKT